MNQNRDRFLPALQSLLICGAVVLILLGGFGQAAAAAPSAREILETTGVQGGLVVHLGCGDGKLTAALHAAPCYLVHGLDADPANVAAAREHLRAEGLYGPVSVDRIVGQRLPYADNLVNLIVGDDLGDVTTDELLRVLRPEGVAYVRQGKSWTKTVKPRDDRLDAWSHFLHGPDNNAVSRDEVVGPPHHMQWVGGPPWARGHEVLASISAVVSDGGRIYYVADEGPIVSSDLPPRWTLVARDAFNGVLLWKRAIDQWEWQHRPFRSGPPQLPRRLVCDERHVYATLGYGAPLTALDGATGRPVRTYADTAGAEEILLADGVLYLVAGDVAQQRSLDQAVRRGQPLPAVARRIMAIDAKSGKTLWQKADVDTSEALPLTLTVGGGRVFFQTLGELICVGAADGSVQWHVARPASDKRPGWSSPTVVVSGDVVISADRAAPPAPADAPRPRTVDWNVTLAGGNAPPGEMIAFRVTDGKRLWTSKCREGYNSPVDVLIANGLLWSGNLVGARDPGITEALDPLTGEVKKQRPRDQEFFTPGMAHHRCYRNKATDRFLLLGRAGVEMVDTSSGDAVAHHWVRGTCQYGVLPANGLLYAPPHTCACYLKTKLNGFVALAPKQSTSASTATAAPRLQRGPAFDAVAPPAPADDDWPMYRHDPARSGSTTARVATQLDAAWRARVGGKLTSPVVAAGKVFVAQVDLHAVHALSAADGEPAWSFTTGARVDSPPTVWQGRVLFGSHDGYVYCLRADDGALAWRFRAAAEDRRVVVQSQLESAQPVSGSVLVEDGAAYFVAGQSSFLDGGLRLVKLDAATGELLAENMFSGRDPETGQQPKSAIRGFDMPTGLPDIFTSNGRYLFMRDLRFDRQLRQQAESERHLMSPTGLLDDTWWHRSYWVWGESFAAGWGGWHRAGYQYPAGRILSFNDEIVYGFGRSFMPRGNAGQWRTGEFYRMFAATKTPTKQAPQQPTRRGKKPAAKSTVNYLWSERTDHEVHAMVLASETLFVAGPHGEAHRSLSAYRGKEGISLRAVSTADGKLLAQLPIDALPVFDGLAATAGRLYLTTRDGQVTCFAGR